MFPMGVQMDGANIKAQGSGDIKILRAWNKVKKGPSLSNCRVLFVNFVLVFFLKSSLHPIFYFFTSPKFPKEIQGGRQRDGDT